MDRVTGDFNFLWTLAPGTTAPVLLRGRQQSISSDLIKSFFQVPSIHEVSTLLICFMMLLFFPLTVPNLSTRFVHAPQLPHTTILIYFLHCRYSASILLSIATESELCQ
jgi:hypothetical protein